MKSLLSLVIVLSLCSGLYAQTECPCCTEPYQQFDFWIGDWVVKDTLGTVVGENLIQKIGEGCIVSEQWRGASGSNGSSMNYYDRTDGTWNQLWVDNSGNKLSLTGKPVQGAMILKGELLTNKEGAQYYNQITWTANNDGTVSQIWELFDLKDALIKTIFTGIYHRK